MEILFKDSLTKSPSVSIVLLDWSVRESYHSLDYLNQQTLPREDYEIIWIEYYDRRSKEIQSKLKKCAASRLHPIVDTWIVMDMPQEVYYHKHLMYNIGIIISSGRIICFCDSDAVFRTTFIESIVHAFDKDPNIVLHMDQVRSLERRFYPFNHPSIEEIMKSPCLNLMNGKPRGLVDLSNPLHWRNGGACMCAMREDLINIGGADEHIDYLGHICGPYEMSFRLINAGKNEVWHPDEWLYHTWHPGQAGDKNYAGPHDGRGVSQTALTARRTGRIMPLVENPAIKTMRYGSKGPLGSLLTVTVSETNMKQWIIDNQEYNQTQYSLINSTIHMKERNSSNALRKLRKIRSITYFIFYIKTASAYIQSRMPFIIETMWRFLGRKVKKSNPQSATTGNSTIHVENLRDLILLGVNFIKYLLWWPTYVIDRCSQCLRDLRNIGIKEIAVFGTGHVAAALCMVSKVMSIKIVAIYDSPVRKKNFMGYKVFPIEHIKGYQGKTVIASFDDLVKGVETLKALGISDKMIVDLW